MATLTNDSLFSVLQSFLSPDVLQKISTEINQPLEKTKSSLKSVIPTLLMGIVNKGSTKEGAESIVSMATRQTVPATVSADSKTLNEGNEVLSSIFGSNLPNTVTGLGTTTGMNTGSITKMMGMAAPLIMGVLGTKIKNEKMNASGLMNFLSQQKTSLMGLIPSGLSNLGGIQNKVESSVWSKIVLGVLLLLGAIWLFTYMRAPKAPVYVDSEMETTTASAVVPAASIGSLQGFMNSTAAAGSMKRFRFENLNFQSGTTTLIRGSETEINQIAFTMKTYPNAKVRIEGFTDNTGTVELNQGISNKRAIAVKDELVSRGVGSSRITTIGMGQRNPVASNTTPEGRAENRRIEFVVTK